MVWEQNCTVIAMMTQEVEGEKIKCQRYWPDVLNKTTMITDDLLTFISYMRHVHKSGPIITHCSAGIGRSGTLICIDVVLGLISRDLEFDISDLVRTMRLQRHGMVQTEDQYIFCYQVVLYVLNHLQHEEQQRGK
ncbi:PREDICTED: tyrosine-protein phosphatase non-receptor type 13-like isoform X2 [Tauraco erythrolophus]|uniref:tyrosine-protein phosphatase non-receptor type 13-like isoform X2 n=1 Tax=Tauraco erythrolophus TaxID=121530 RepID=UPI0005239FEC|nr:PREDICTED: tyrosine-protein phosphatase non-receptor type 13-like isoform X2 [Tauraco erythrolophus]